jgi:hypothetical protein
MLNDEATIDSSYNYGHRFIGGESARRKAEKIARTYLGVDK